MLSDIIPSFSRSILIGDCWCEQIHLWQKKGVHRDEVLCLPLIMHRRAGLQKAIAEWAHTRIERLNIAATYNVIYGSPITLVQSGLGNLLVTRDLLDPELTSGVRFLPLDPPLETHYALVWKKDALLTKTAERFLSLFPAQ